MTLNEMSRQADHATHGQSGNWFDAQELREEFLKKMEARGEENTRVLVRSSGSKDFVIVMDLVDHYVSEYMAWRKGMPRSILIGPDTEEARAAL